MVNSKQNKIQTFQITEDNENIYLLDYTIPMDLCTGKHRFYDQRQFLLFPAKLQQKIKSCKRVMQKEKKR
jgi:hypothetical protein